MYGGLTLALRRVALGLTILIWSGSAVVSGEIDPNAPPLVRIASGTVAGVASDGIVSFKGIPYAAPPIGPRRWRPPAPPSPWTGVLKADDFGAPCPQTEPPRFISVSRAATTSEDCLTLNVWAPAAHTGPLPVMVWVHGGGNTRGSSADRFSDGSAFARDGVVLVSMNYRLGVLGFFAHPALVREAGGEPTGNFGLLDQIAALRWVRANIAAFGGDPSNVTTFGESAGGEDVVALSTTDATAGLFRRTIAESAGELWDGWPTLPQAEARGATIATSLGLPGDRATAEQLRALPVGALEQLDDDDRVGAMVDGTLIRAAPWVALAHGTRVPIIIGTNDDDGSLLGTGVPLDRLYPRLSPADLTLVRTREAAHGVTSEDAVAQRLFGEGYFAVPARWVAEHATAAAPAYLYRFDYVASFLSFQRSAATHGSEVPFVFATFPQPLLTDTDRKVQAALHDCWIAFARTGRPSCAAIPAWPSYDRADRRIVVFDASPSLRDPGDTDVMDLLERKLFPG